MSKTGERQEGFALAKQQASGELAASAAAAQAKAEIEAAYAIALHRPRKLEDARTKILDACRRPAFAERARYIKPVGNRRIEGPSIRFAETAVQAFGNIRSSTRVIYEDDAKRILKVDLVDLETNLTYGKEITINKTVERRTLKQGQIAISERENSTGQKVYLIAATEDDLFNKVNAIESKIIRNCGLRLIPQDIIDEAMDLCIETLQNGAKDVKARGRKMADAFAAIGIQPSDLETYMGKPLAQATAMDFTQLTAVHNAIRDGEAKWADFAKKTPEKGSVGLEDLQPGKPETHTGPSERQRAPESAEPAAAGGKPAAEAPADEKAKKPRGRPKGSGKKKTGEEAEPVNLLKTSPAPAAAENDDRIQTVAVDTQTGEVAEKPEELLGYIPAEGPPGDDAKAKAKALADQASGSLLDPADMSPEESLRLDRQQSLENLQASAENLSIEELRERCNAAWLVLDANERAKAVKTMGVDTKEKMIAKLKEKGDFMDFLNAAHSAI